MPAAAARVEARRRPRRFEITTAIRASSRPSPIASMSACRLLPRPEIRTPIAASPAARRSVIDRRPFTGSARAVADLGDADRRRCGSPAAASASQHRAHASRRARDDQADAHVERPQHVVVRHAAGLLQPLEDRRDAATPRDRSTALRAGRQDARQVVGDPAAGDVRHALDQRPTRAAAGSTGRYERCGASSASPIVAPSSGHARVARRARRRRTRSAAPASSRWCAGRTTAGRSATSPGDDAPCRRSAARARHDADDEAGDVVLAVRVEAGHLGGLAAEQRAAVRRGTRSPAPRRSAPRRPGRAGRSPGSRGRTAAARPGRGCR